MWKLQRFAVIAISCMTLTAGCATNAPIPVPVAASCPKQAPVPKVLNEPASTDPALIERYQDLIRELQTSLKEAIKP